MEGDDRLARLSEVGAEIGGLPHPAPGDATASCHVIATLFDPSAVARRGWRAPTRLNWPTTRTIASGYPGIEEKMRDDANATTSQAREFSAWACGPEKRLLAGSMGGTVDG